MSKAGAVLEEVKKAVVGKDEVLVQVLLAILAGGHILLEDLPGVGKTTMALAFRARWRWNITGCSSHRMCCRPISQAFPCITSTRAPWNTSRGPCCATCFWQTS